MTEEVASRASASGVHGIVDVAVEVGVALRARLGLGGERLGSPGAPAGDLGLRTAEHQGEAVQEQRKGELGHRLEPAALGASGDEIGGRRSDRR